MAITVTESMLKAILPLCRNPATYAGYLQKTVNEFNIDTIDRFSDFIAQVGHESSQLTVFVENLNYSADGLLKIFSKYFNSSNVNDYARQPVKIASKVYANRMGNGSEASQEGYKFRGRGAIQTTGKTNYTAVGNYLGIDLVGHPELLENPETAIRAAGYWWQSNNMNKVADKVVNNVSGVKDVTKVVNGGTNGLEDREDIYKRALKFFGV